MRKFFKGCLGVAAALIAVHFALANVNAGVFSECSPCEEAFCNPCDPCNPCDVVCGKKSQWNVGGWLEAGLYVNQYGQRNVYHYHGLGIDDLCPWSGNTALLNNVRQSDVQMNQAWMYVEKTLDTRRGFDVGGRADFVYGTDAFFTQSAGFEYQPTALNPYAQRGWGDGDYYASFAQAYAEVGYGKLSVKAGKILTPLGHEDIMAPNRFFYSLNYAFYVNPDTHTGVIATWKASDKLSVVGGWTNGANMTFYRDNDNTAVFGAIYTPTKKVSLTYWGAIGKDKDAFSDGNGGTYDCNYFLQSVIAKAKLGKRWEYAFEWTLINFDGGYTDPWHWGAYGINNELIYRFNKKWAVGLRAEWMHTYGGRYGGMADDAGSGTDFYEYTLGVNWTPNKWLLIRPELRYDVVYGENWDGSRFSPFNTFSKDGSFRSDPRNEQLSGGFSAVVKF